jgi:type II secretory pathway pseudopilin PulG
MNRVREEQGFVLITAIILLTVMLGFGIALVTLANSQQSASSREQWTEGAFNLAEAALNAQVAQLSREWPGVGTHEKSPGSLVATCTPATSESTNYCPESAVLEKAYPSTGSTSCTGTEAWGSPLTNKWVTYVREDLGGSPYFDSKKEQKANEFDEGHEVEGKLEPWRKLWVRAVGVVNCHAVTVVSLVSEQLAHTSFPEAAVSSNWFKTGNKGNKIILKRKGKGSGQNGKFTIRCEPPHPSECEEYEREGKKEGQIQPELLPEEQQPSMTPSTTLSTEQLESLKSQAKSEGHFFSPPNCPASLEALAGRPVYVEGCGGLKFSGGAANSATKPGFLVLANGSIDLGGGGAIYYGVIYDANLLKSSEVLVTVRGGAKIVGEIIVDGSGGVELGDKGGKGESESVAFEYSAGAAENFETVTGVAATRNSFRLLPLGQ